MVQTESEEFSEWKMTTAAVQLSGKISVVGEGGGIQMFPFLTCFNFSFSWPRKLFPPRDVCADSCGVTQELHTKCSRPARKCQSLVSLRASIQS